MPVVKLYANLRKLAGTKEISIPGANVRVAIDELARQKPLVLDALFVNGVLRPHIVITLNGHNVTDLAAPVAEHDIVAIFPPIAGGTSSLPPLLRGEGE
jgi:MoaD family protein